MRRAITALAALAARDAACGHLDNQLVTKTLTWTVEGLTDGFVETVMADEGFTLDEIAALRAATFEVTE
jgi:hypothetical protein